MRDLRRRVGTGIGLVCAVSLIVVATGCVATETSPRPASSSGAESVAADDEAPTFEGPFAAEYQEAWDKSTTRAVRMILADGLITDQEWSQVRAALTKCVEDQGISFVEYRDDGSFEVNVGEMDGESANRMVSECTESSGEAWIGWLYRSQSSNPENVPETRLLTQCLVRNGAVPSSYTEEQYFDDAPDFSFPWVDDDGFEIFEQCSKDMGYVR